MKPVGYYNAPRSLFTHPMFKDAPMNEFQALSWLIAAAAYEPTRVRVNNGRSFDIIALNRGQLCFSRSSLMKEWKWTSEKKVRTFLDRLQQEGLIHIVRGQQSSRQGREMPPIITICNYNVFLAGQAAEGASEELQEASKGPAMGQQTGQQTGPAKFLQVIENKDISGSHLKIGASNGPANGPGEKEVKERNIAAQRFGEFWEAYPLKTSRAAAELSFVRAISRISVDELISRTKAFAAEWERKLADRPDDKRFIPGPVKFLDEERYLSIKPAGHIADDEEWRKRIECYRETKEWAMGWGPSPGNYGCKAPKHLQALVSRGAA